MLVIEPCEQHNFFSMGKCCALMLVEEQQFNV